MKNIYKLLLIVFIGISSCFYPFNNVYAEDEDGIQETTSQTDESEDVSESVSNETTTEINKTEEENAENNDQNSIQEESDSVEGEGYYEILGVNETGLVFGDYVNPQGGGFPYEDLKMQGVSYLYESPAESNGIEPISDETMVEVDKLIKAALATKPFTSSEVVDLLGNSKNTLLGESNNTDLVKTELLSNNGDKSEYIYIVDENAVVFVVKDVNGNGIPNACVSISYLDDNGTRINRTIKTTDGEVKGVAAFDDLKGTRYGFVDIEVSGYHSVTFLDEEMTGGVVKNVVLEKNKEFEIYLRTVDLDGRDLINNDTTLTLVKDYDETLPFSIIVSSTGYRQLPKTLKLVSMADNRTIYTFAAPSHYKGDKDSYIFQANKKWVTQDALLKENDKLALEIDGETFPLKNVVVENAQVDPGYIDDKDMPIKGDTLIDDKEDAGSLMNVFNIGLSELSLNVSVGIMPSGKFWIMCTRKIESWSKDMPELFGKSPSPKAAEKTGTIMERITKSVEASFDKAVWTDEKIQAKTTTLLIDPTYGNINTSVVGMIVGGYNKDAQRYEGDATIALNFNFTMGKQAYTMISFVPVTFGAEFSLILNAKIGAAINANTMFPPTGVEFDGFRTKPFQFHINPTFRGFVCAGIRNALGFDFTGTAAVDIGFVWHAADKGDQELEEPHRFVDFSANLSANIYFLVMTKTIVIIGTEKPVRWYDSWDKYKPKPKFLFSDGVELKPIDLNASMEKIVTGSLQSASGNALETYRVDVPTQPDNLKLNRPTGLELLSGESYVDNQIQMITTQNKTVVDGEETITNTTALFRLIAKDGMTKLVYQLQNPATGEFEDTLYEVPMPDGRSVYEFAATSQKHAMYNVSPGYVYIGAITGDVNTDDPDTRAYSTSVVGVIVDINNGTLIKQKVVKTQTPNYNKFYFAPMPAHTTNDLAIAFKAADSYTTSDKFINYLATTDGTIQAMSENVPVYCAGIVNSDWQATYWTVDTANSNSTTLALKGYNGKGQSSSTSPYGHVDDANFHISFNVADFKKKFGDADPVSCIGSLRGKEFIIVAGDLYRLDGANNEHSTITATKMESAHYSDVTLSGGAGHYQMLTDHETGTLFITSIKSVYQAEEGATYKMLGNELELNYIVEDTNSIVGTYYALHGPRKYMLEGIDAYKYTCSYDSSKMGIALAVDTYHDSTNATCDVYAWRENAGYGMELTDFYIENNVITNTQKYVDGYITYQNAGYGTADVVTLQIKDSSGTALIQADYNSSTGEYIDRGEIYGYSPAKLYPADKITIPIHFKANPKWGTNTAESITVSMLNENGEVVSTSSLMVDSPKLTFSGKQEVLNGDHYISFDVSNNSIISVERGNILLVGVYSDNSKNIPIDPENAFACPNILRTLSTGKEKGIFSSGDKTSNQKYNISYNIETMWEAHLGEGLSGVNVYFVSKDGKLISDHSINIANPYIGQPKKEGHHDNGSNQDYVESETVIEPETNKRPGVKPQKSEDSLGLGTQENKTYPILYIDGKEVTVDYRITQHKSLEGYLLYMKDTNGKEVLIGILSKDGLTVTLFEDYEKILGNGAHKAEMVYEDGHGSLLVVNIFEETIDEPLPIEPEKPGNKLLIPLAIGAFILIALIAYLIYKKIRSDNEEL